MDTMPLPHYHGEEPSHTKVIRALLDNTDTFTRPWRTSSGSWATPAASAFSGCCVTARSAW